jgi:hypothetical protein
MTKIDSRSVQVHFLFEGLLAGEIQTITHQQREIILVAMEKAYKLTSRRKQVEKLANKAKTSNTRSFNQEGRQGKRTREFEEEPLTRTRTRGFEEEPLTRANRFVMRIKQACYVLMFLLAVVLGYSLYIQYF